jgi:hypothetical protein
VGVVDKQGGLTNRGVCQTPLSPLGISPGEVCPQLSPTALHFSPGSTMDEQVFWSLCDPASYWTFDEQKTPRSRKSRTVFLDGNTYIHMVIELSGHWVAVQVTISPFTLEKFHGQTFFSSQLRYGPYCRQISDTHTSHLVVDTVQRIVDSHYRPVCWDFSSDQWYVDLQLGEIYLTRIV